MPKDITHRFPEFEKFITFGTYYQKRLGKEDKLSNSVLDLKSGDNYAIQKWGQYLLEIIPSLHKGKYFSAGLVRPFGHDELKCDEAQPLSGLKDILIESPLLYDCTKFLSKSKKTQPLKFLKKEEKKQELQKTYSYVVNSDQKAEPFPYIIFDDIVTTGTTIKAIASAIKESRPNAVLYGFTLLETYDSYQPQTIDNNKIFHDIFLDDGIPDWLKALTESDEYKLWESNKNSWWDDEVDAPYIYDLDYDRLLNTTIEFMNVDDMLDPLHVYNEDEDIDNDEDEREGEDLPF